MLSALLNAVKCLNYNIKIETIICLNGTTDKTLNILKSKKIQQVYKKLNLSVVKSKLGKLNAEKKIVKIRKFDGFILFCDADTILDKKSIKYLYNRLLYTNYLRVVYAKVLPIFPRKLNNFQNIMKDYYDMRKFLPDRGCFHGRMFMIRDEKDILKEYDINKRLKKIPQNIIKKLYLTKGPICDDIILSAAIVHEHGQQSVEKVHKSKVYFYPPSNMYDFFLGVRRYVIEIKRINILFPEYTKINNSKKFERPINIQKSTIFITKKRNAELLMEFEHFLNEIVTVYELNNYHLELWEPVKSSKIADRSRNRME